MEKLVSVGQQLSRGCWMHYCTHGLHDSSDVCPSDRLLTLKITIIHTAGYKFSLLNCTVIAWHSSNTAPPAHKSTISLHFQPSEESLWTQIPKHLGWRSIIPPSLWSWQFITTLAMLHYLEVLHWPTPINFCKIGTISHHYSRCTFN